jgi:Putative zinc-finger
MNEKCFDSGTIQAFLDGELAPEMSVKVTNHIAVCENCALELSEAEDETAFAFSALDNEFNTLVPTQRLWAKINDSIVEERKQNSVWHRVWAFISVSLLNPSITVAAGIFVIFGMFAAALFMRPDIDNPAVAINQTRTNPTINQPKTLPITDEKTLTTVTPNQTETSPLLKISNRQNPRENNIQKLVSRADYREIETQRPKTKDQKPKTENLLYLPGEESYVKTIATLKQTVDGQKDTVMKPSSRISFERDLAVVNDSIARMKKEVRKNPKNETAKQVLYASYQNKIDLLNSVSERNELMASLQ